MKSFMVAITNNNLEVIKYMVTAKNEMFAECDARIRYERFYGGAIRSITITPIS